MLRTPEGLWGCSTLRAQKNQVPNPDSGQGLREVWGFREATAPEAQTGKSGPENLKGPKSETRDRAQKRLLHATYRKTHETLKSLKLVEATRVPFTGSAWYGDSLKNLKS